MIKRFFLAILIAVLFLAPTITHAQEEITLLDSTAEVYFPSALVFNIKAESSSDDIAKVRLHYQVDRMNYARVTSEAWPTLTPSPKIETEWVWDMRKVSLPAGAIIRYWWTIEDAAGNKLITPVELVRFDDLRYSWQTLTAGQLNLLWYEGSQSFAEELIAAGQLALEKLARDTGAYLEKKVYIYVYANSEDLRGAMIFPREWTGGVAFTEYSIIALGISQGQLDWGKRALAHELGHLVIHQITFSPYGAILPTWLDEGLALHAEGEPDPYLQSWLKKAISEQRLISVRSLSGPFSAKAEEAYISYAQSQSLVEFLLQKYGRDKMLHLLTLLKEGNTYDEALTKVYGFDQYGLDGLWQEHITSQQKSQSGFGCAPPNRTSHKETPREEGIGRLVALKAPAMLLVGELFSNLTCHTQPFAFRYSEPFPFCHSEGTESLSPEKGQRPKNLAQAKLHEQSFTLLRAASGNPSLSLRVTTRHYITGVVN